MAIGCTLELPRSSKELASSLKCPSWQQTCWHAKYQQHLHILLGVHAAEEEDWHVFTPHLFTITEDREESLKGGQRTLIFLGHKSGSNLCKQNLVLVLGKYLWDKKNL